MSNILKCTALDRSFGSLKAIDNINLDIEEGKIVGLLGPNGAGKTTLLKMMNGLLQPDNGEIRICEMKPGVRTKRLVSYLPDRMYFADWMKVGDIVELFEDFYTDFNKTKSTEMCRVLGLDSNQIIKTLSKGTKEKMQLMLVMSREARLYLLDEPIGGVDPATRDFILKTIITNYAEHSSVLISTHLISDVEQILDEVIFLQKGRIILQDTVDNIREKNKMSVDALFRDMFKFEETTGGEM